MSTYGVTAVVDLPPAVDEDVVRHAVCGPEDPGGPEVLQEVVPAPDGWRRWSFTSPRIEFWETFAALLASVGTGRAVVAEDLDEFGALFLVLEARDGTVSTVYRRYVLPVDPRDPAQVALAVEQLETTDPRLEDVTGPDAARAAARLLGVDPALVLEVEQRADDVHELMGAIGGPFPWWFALDLPWAGDDAGSAALDEGMFAIWRRAAPGRGARDPVPLRWTAGVLLAGSAVLVVVLLALLR